MSKIKIVCESDEEVETIIKYVERHIDMKDQDEDVQKQIKIILQNIFDEGRKIQKQLSTCKLDL